MDPRRLLLFRSVARSGSLSAAARELATTQPAVSQQLRLLEREAGLALVIARPARGG
jgi:DNA-binding transcriptional LysR family regulator